MSSKKKKKKNKGIKWSGPPKKEYKPGLTKVGRIVIFVIVLIGCYFLWKVSEGNDTRDAIWFFVFFIGFMLFGLSSDDSHPVYGP